MQASQLERSRNEDFASWYRSLAHASPALHYSAQLKRFPEDFQVEEELGFSPAGEGEHVFLYVEKRGITSTEVASQLASFCNIKLSQVSFSGLKDKHAVSRQWFSLHLPAKADQQRDWEAFNTVALAPGKTLRILKQSANNRKLRRGVHRNNSFRILLRDLKDIDAAMEPLDQSRLDTRLQLLATQGFPNYFGYQRFGRNFDNINRALTMFASRRRLSRSKRSIYLSAARSLLFNAMLSQRVSAGSWNCYQPGDKLVLKGSRSFFRAEVKSPAEDTDTESLQRRIDTGDLSIGGILPGADCGELLGDNESKVLAQYPELTEGVLTLADRSEVRSYRAIPEDLHWQFDDSGLLLKFKLAKGQFATALLRELLDLEDSSVIAR